MVKPPPPPPPPPPTLSHCTHVLASRGAPSVRGCFAWTCTRVVCQHGDVDPRARVPPRVVVALFRALETPSVTVGVLTRAPLIRTAHALVGSV